MNVYDFDKTIYDGDSTVHFWLFCSRRHPGVFVRCLPRLMKGAVLYAFGRIPKEDWKERFFSFLNYLPSNETMVSSFWEIHFAKIKKWYLDQKQDSDVIISASPVFLLEPVSKRLGVSLIATEVDPRTGRFSGRNCSGGKKSCVFVRCIPTPGLTNSIRTRKKTCRWQALRRRRFLSAGMRSGPGRRRKSVRPSNA